MVLHFFHLFNIWFNRSQLYSHVAPGRVQGQMSQVVQPLESSEVCYERRGEEKVLFRPPGSVKRS